MRANLDGLDEKVKEHYTEENGKFILDVTKVEGLGLEDVSGLKSTVEKLRVSEKALQVDAKKADDTLKALQTTNQELIAKYDGIDVVAAKDALDKISEIKDWDGETKVKEAVQVAEQRMEQKMQTKLDEVVKQNTIKITGLESDLTDSQSQLQEAVVTSKIIEAVSKENGNVDVLMPHVRNQVVMVKDSHGKFKPEVQKADGTPRVGDSSGNDMTITQLVQEMKGQDTFAGCFSGANSTGTGKQDLASNTTQKKTDGKVVNASDTKGMSDNLADIAAGKTKVNMEA